MYYGLLVKKIQFSFSFSKASSQTICQTISEANSATKNKLHEKWGNVKRKLSPLVKKSTSSPCKQSNKH